MLFFFLIHQNLVTGGATSLQQTAFPAFYDVFEEPGSQPVQWVLQLCRETISCSRSSHCHLPFADRVTAPLHCGASTAQRAQSTAALSPPHLLLTAQGRPKINLAALLPLHVQKPGLFAEAKSESCGCFYQTTPTRSHSSVIIKLLLLIHRFCLKKKKKEKE